MCGGSTSVLPPPFHMEVHCTLGSASRLNSNQNTGVNAGVLQRPRSRPFGETTATWVSALYTNTSPRCERYTLAPTTACPAQVARPCGVSQCDREMTKHPPKAVDSSKRKATMFRRTVIRKVCYRCRTGRRVLPTRSGPSSKRCSEDRLRTLPLGALRMNRMQGRPHARSTRPRHVRGSR